MKKNIQIWPVLFTGLSVLISSCVPGPVFRLEPEHDNVMVYRRTEKHPDQ